MSRGTNQKLKLLYLAKIMQEKTDDGHFSVSVEIAVRSQFFGWVMGLGGGMKIVGPEDVVEEMREKIDNIRNLY